MLLRAFVVWGMVHYNSQRTLLWPFMNPFLSYGFLLLGLVNVARNNLTGTIPEFFGGMPRLDFIDMTLSGLTGTIPETFCTSDRYRSRTLVVQCNVSDLCSCCDKKVTIDCNDNDEEKGVLDDN